MRSQRRRGWQCSPCGRHQLRVFKSPYPSRIQNLFMMRRGVAEISQNGSPLAAPPRMPRRNAGCSLRRSRWNVFTWRMGPIPDARGTGAEFVKTTPLIRGRTALRYQPPPTGVLRYIPSGGWHWTMAAS